MSRIFKSSLLLLILFTFFSSAFSQSKPASVLDFWNDEQDKGEVGQIVAPFCVINDFAVDQDENQVNGYFSDGDCDFCGAGVQYIADNFIAPKDGMIDRICYLGGYFPSNINQTNEVFSIVFYEDNAGLPGNILAGPTTINVSEKNTTGGTLFGVDEFGYQGDFPPVAVTMGTTYWVSIQANTIGNTDSWFWETGNQDATNGILGGSGSFEDPQVNWLTIPEDLAFALGYEEAAAVPTLEQWGLIILGILVLIFGVVTIKNKVFTPRIIKE